MNAQVEGHWDDYGIYYGKRRVNAACAEYRRISPKQRAVKPLLTIRKMWIRASVAGKKKLMIIGVGFGGFCSGSYLLKLWPVSMTISAVRRTLGKQENRAKLTH